MILMSFCSTFIRAYVNNYFTIKRFDKVIEKMVQFFALQLIESSCSFI